MLTDVDVSHALRMLARMMVRSYHVAGDHQAIDRASPPASTLTVVPKTRTHHDDEAA